MRRPQAALVDVEDSEQLGPGAWQQVTRLEAHNESLEVNNARHWRCFLTNGPLSVGHSAVSDRHRVLHNEAESGAWV